MMAVAEANHPQGTLLGAAFTFVLYGVGPVALVAYLLGHGGRRRAREARAALQAQASIDAAPASTEPDGASEAAADAIAPVREELRSLGHGTPGSGSVVSAD